MFVSCGRFLAPFQHIFQPSEMRNIADYMFLIKHNAHLLIHLSFYLSIYLGIYIIYNIYIYIFYIYIHIYIYIYIYQKQDIYFSMSYILISSKPSKLSLSRFGKKFAILFWFSLVRHIHSIDDCEMTNVKRALTTYWQTWFT